MSILSNKLKLEVKSNEAEVAKFISTEKQADIVFAPREKITEEQAIFSAKTDDTSSNIFQVSALIGTNTTPLASFKYTNTDLTTTAIVKGNLIIDGSALALGTVILNDENDNTFSNIMPKSPYSNLISERYTSLLYSNINTTSNTITTTINALYNTLNANLSNVFSIQKLFEGISFTSFSDSDFDNRLLTRTTDNLRNGTSNTFIINKTHPSNLTINNILNVSNLITKSINASHVRANKLVGDGSHLTNIYANNDIDNTTNTIPELPYPLASNLYYTSNRAIPIIISSNINASNFMLATSNNLIAFNSNSEADNSNYIFHTSNSWFYNIDTLNYSLSNTIFLESTQFYADIVASNSHISNMTDSFQSSIYISTSNYVYNISNYIFSTSNAILHSLAHDSSNTSNMIEIFNSGLYSNIILTSNTLAYSILDTSNTLSYSLLMADTNISNYMWHTSNTILGMTIDSFANNSNNVSNVYYALTDRLQSNLIDTSNVMLYVFDDLSSNLLQEDKFYSNLSTDIFALLYSSAGSQFLNVSNYTSNIYLELSNLSYVSYDDSSNSLYLTSNVAYDYAISLFDKINIEDTVAISNYVVQTSNNLIKYIYSNFTNQFADISADITAISDSVNQRIDLLTADVVPEGTSNYFSSNLFNTKIRSLTLDDIRNGAQMQYITNNVHPENLTVEQQLSASNLTVAGTESVLFTNVINADQLELMSAGFNDAFTVKQTFANRNIMEIWTNENVAMTVSQDKVGIKTASPVYELDVVGTVKASAFIASGQYLQNVNLSDKTTAHLAEDPSGLRLYYTPERTGLIVSYCNILVSNYMIDTSNAIRGLRNSLVANEIVYADNMSNAVSIFVNAGHISQSNYVSNASNQLMLLAYATVLNQNQSNYIRQVQPILHSYMYNLDGRQSNYVLQTSNNLSRMLVAGDSNNSNYISASCNINLGQLAVHAWNASNYIRITSNALLGQLFTLENPQSNYIRETSNAIVAQFLGFNVNMSNYAMHTSNTTRNMFAFININNSNHISTTSNSLMRYIIQSVANLQTSGSGNVSATATYINRWNEPANYITNSKITSVPFNYISYNDGTSSAVGIGVTAATASLEVYTANPTLNSIKVSNNIWAQTGMVASSDMRIKKDIVDIDDGKALEQILAIEPKIYNYKDTRRQTKDVYGFIAQQVAEVIPNAVRLQSACIPDIYCYGVLSEKVLMINEDEPPVLQENDKIGILFNREEYILTVDDIYSENTFAVDNIYNLKGTVFIYGRVVDDFHTIDKDYIYTLNVCATQDLHRRQESISACLDSLKTSFGYNALEACTTKVQENIDDTLSIYQKTKQLEYNNSLQTDEYMQLWNINKNFANIVVAQNTNISGRLDAIQLANMQLKQDNHILANNNSNLKNMIMTMSDRILHIRSILQRNNII